MYTSIINFKTSFVFQYGDDGDNKSFLLEVEWHSNYPTEAPRINLDMFYNKHMFVQFLFEYYK